MARKNTSFDTQAKDDLEKRLQDFNKRLGRDDKSLQNENTKKPDSTGYGNAFRLSSEFIAAIGVGVAIGYGIDWTLGTKPWAMIVFLMLGFVAAIINVLRAAGEISGPIGVDMSGQNKNTNDES